MRKVFAAIAALAAASGAHAAPVQWSGNGHYYEFVAPSVSWEAALAAAGSATYLGNKGYLATVTSADEQAFIYNSVTTTATWFSGSDRANEGTWIWEAGPEKGTVFWLGTSGGSSPTYANWSGGEPNDSGGEDYLWGNWSGSRWNDIGSTNLGYVIEYGGLSNGVPEPAAWALLISGFGVLGAASRRRKAMATVTA